MDFCFSLGILGFLFFFDLLNFGGVGLFFEIRWVLCFLWCVRLREEIYSEICIKYGKWVF